MNWEAVRPEKAVQPGAWGRARGGVGCRDRKLHEAIWETDAVEGPPLPYSMFVNKANTSKHRDSPMLSSNTRNQMQ